jgi:hypothetical protein
MSGLSRDDGVTAVVHAPGRAARMAMACIRQASCSE